MKLNTENTKEIINSLCLILHNHREVTFTSNEACGTFTGKIITMDGIGFEIDSKKWKWEYTEITSIQMN